MNCLHCGAELEKLRKWRGNPDFCSESCKKKAQDESDRLAVSRLRIPSSEGVTRITRISPGPSQAATTALAPIHTAADSERPGSSDTAPELAGFLHTKSCAGGAQLAHAYRSIPHRPFSPVLPSGSSRPHLGLDALAVALDPLQPEFVDSPVILPCVTRLLLSASIEECVLPMPECPPPTPAWPAALGMRFSVLGFEDRFIASAAVSQTETTLDSPLSIPHRPAQVVPTLQPALALDRQASPSIPNCEIPPLPFINGARLRIHLPQPDLLPLRPRFVFKPKDSPVAALAVEIPVPAPAEDSTPKPTPIKKSSGARPSAKPHAVTKPAAEPPARPAASKPLSRVSSTDSPTAKPALATPAKPKPETPIPAQQKQSVATDFAFSAADAAPPNAWQRIPVLAKIAAILVILCGTGVWYFAARTDSTLSASALPAPSAPSSLPSADAWQSADSADAAGSALSRKLTLYKPAKGRSDYSMDISGEIEERALGLVFRVSDPANYYCLKIERSSDAASPSHRLVKFAVVDGEEQNHILVPLPAGLIANGPIRIRLEVAGPKFMVAVNGRPVDLWVDHRIPSGSVGFANERTERARIQSVKVSL